MTRIVYLNGEYLPPEQAQISIFDRAVTFGDAIYDVAGVLDGKLVDFEHHMQRYFSSLDKLGIPSPLTQDEILAAFRKLVELNALDEGLVYLQVTRGEAERDFTWPDDIRPNVFMFTQVKSSLENAAAETGVSVVSTPDLRWARRDIKSVNLLGQVLAKRIAQQAGAYEALLIDADGYITECGSTSFFAVRGDEILTRPLNNDILPGVTRRALVGLCGQHDLKLRECRFTLADALGSDEAFLSGASSYVLPVTRIDEQPVGDGRPGPTTRRMREIYIDYARASLV